MSVDPETPEARGSDLRGRVVTAAVALVAGLAVVGGVLLLLAAGGDDESTSDAASQRRFSPAADPPTTPTPPAAAPETGHPVARIVARTQLRNQPNGRVIARIGRKTEFGSPRVLSVVRERPGWLGVVATELPNGRVGWIPAANARVGRSEWDLRLDLSERVLRVRRAGRTVRRLRVGIGTDENPTPTGRFAVTDALNVDDPSSPYGCCVLALNAHQTKGLSDWPGGDRIAIHATNQASDLGSRVSHGCVRASPAALRPLLSSVPLGSPVVVQT